MSQDKTLRSHLKNHVYEKPVIPLPRGPLMNDYKKSSTLVYDENKISPRISRHSSSRLSTRTSDSSKNIGSSIILNDTMESFQEHSLDDILLTGRKADRKTDRKVDIPVNRKTDRKTDRPVKNDTHSYQYKSPSHMSLSKTDTSSKYSSRDRSYDSDDSIPSSSPSSSSSSSYEFVDLRNKVKSFGCHHPDGRYQSIDCCSTQCSPRECHWKCPPSNVIYVNGCKNDMGCIGPTGSPGPTGSIGPTGSPGPVLPGVGIVNMKVYNPDPLEIILNNVDQLITFTNFSLNGFTISGNQYNATVSGQYYASVNFSLSFDTSTASINISLFLLINGIPEPSMGIRLNDINGSGIYNLSFNGIVNLIAGQYVQLNLSNNSQVVIPAIVFPVSNMTLHRIA